MSNPPKTPSFSSLWDRCEWFELDAAAPLHKAWWDVSMTTTKLALPAPDPIITSDDESMSDMDVHETPTSIGFETIDLGSFLDGTAPGRILIRTEYSEILKVLEERQSPNSRLSRKPPSGAIVTGQPGIGKTCFLWYLLRYRLRWRRPTVFLLNGKTPFFFCEDGAFQPSSNPAAATDTLMTAAIAHCRKDDGRLWVLVDMGEERVGPPARLINANVYVVQTTSPDQMRYTKWSKQTNHGRSVAYSILMNPWSWEELEIGLHLELEREPTDKELVVLQQSFYRRGPVPRTVYAGLRDQDVAENNGLLSDQQQTFDAALNKLTLTEFKALVNEAGASMPSSALSHEVICISRPDDTSAEWFKINVTPLSPYILTRLIKGAMFRELEEKRDAFRILSGKTETSAYRGWIFECYAHIVLSSPSYVVEAADPTNSRLELVRLTPSRGKTMACPSSSPASYDHFPLIDRDIRRFKKTEDWAAEPVVDNIYNQPEAPYNPGFDSFVVSGNVAYIFQMTAAAQHSIDSKHQAGIEMLMQFIPPRATIWRYILVVPHDVEDYKLTGVDRRWLAPGPQKEFYIASLKLKK